MNDADYNLLLSDLLARRREFIQHVDPRHAGPAALRDVEYVLVWYLIHQLRIRALYVDDAAVGQLFRAIAPHVGAADLSVYTEDGTPLAPAPPAPAPPAGAESLTSLHLLGVGNWPKQDWLNRAAGQAAAALCYGLGSPAGANLTQTLSALSGDEEPAYLPVFGMAPALWRAASFLVVRSSRRPVLSDALAQFTARFNAADLNPLELAENNMRLRATLQRHTGEGSAQAELDQLKSQVTALQADLSTARRLILLQEKQLTGRSPCPSRSSSASAATNGTDQNR